MRHILVPTDFSESARSALEYAVELCQESQGRITLLHVSHTEKINETLMGLDALEYLSKTLELSDFGWLRAVFRRRRAQETGSAEVGSVY